MLRNCGNAVRKKSASGDRLDHHMQEEYLEGGTDACWGLFGADRADY